MEMRDLGPEGKPNRVLCSAQSDRKCFRNRSRLESAAGCRPRIASTISGRGRFALCMLRPSKQEETKKERLNLADDLRQLAEGASNRLGAEGLET
jgi:hypothetical protein